jgi:hypothetical protein
VGLIRNIVVGVSGTGLAASVAFSLGGFDNTTRDETGQIVESGEISVFNLQPGDCLADLNFSNEEVEQSVGVPCTEAHRFEVFAETTIKGLDGFSQEAIFAEADDFCGSRFDEYVGIPVNDTTLFVGYLYPTRESWANGDNEVTCYLSNESETVVYESWKDSML